MADTTPNLKAWQEPDATFDQVRDRATVAAEYRLNCSPHEWGEDDSLATALFVGRALAELKRAQDEATYWRQDAAARLRTYTTIAKACAERGEDTRVAEITVSILLPTRAALASALAGDIYWPLCEGCDKPVQEGDAVYSWEGGEVAHVDCTQPHLADPLPAGAQRQPGDPEHTPEGIAAALAQAVAYLDAED